MEVSQFQYFIFHCIHLSLRVLHFNPYLIQLSFDLNLPAAVAVVPQHCTPLFTRKKSTASMKKDCHPSGG
jgi:hypothetical protein